MPKTKEPSQRQLRVGEEIRHILADVFIHRDFNDDILRGASITVTEVDVAPDMRNATAYVSPLRGSAASGLSENDIIAELNAQAGQFNHALAKRLTMKFSPRLRFAADHRFDYAEKIDSLLHKARQVAADDE